MGTNSENNISKRRTHIFKNKMSSETIPKDLRQLRACLSCSLVKTFDQWENDGCENCGAILGMRGNRDNVYDCTSANFDGMVASCKPDDSWVCKWQRISKFKPGVYAISVSGRLPQQIVRDMQRAGMAYRSRYQQKIRKIIHHHYIRIFHIFHKTFF